VYRDRLGDAAGGGASPAGRDGAGRALRAAAEHGQGTGDCGGGRPGERGELVQALGGCGEQFAAGQAGAVAGDLAGSAAGWPAG
jgi:hypothetical protein